MLSIRSALKKRIQQKLSSLVGSGAAPGVQLSLGWKDVSLGSFQAGVSDPLSQTKVQSQTLFDLSSMTKIICTVSLLMKELQKNPTRSLSDPLKSLFPSFSSALKEKTVADLLNHRAGLAPIFENTEDLNEREQRVRLFLNEVDRTYESPEEEQIVYSDIDFMLLGIALEQIHGKRLREVFNSTPTLRFGPISMANFLSRAVVKKPFAASLLSLDIEPQWINGDVQDPRAQWLGGDAGHAGLFGNALSVEDWGRQLYMSYHGKGLELSDKVVRTFIDFTKKSRNFVNGFDTPSQDGLSQAGKHFSDESVGHLGYSGTSVWIDLKTGARVCLLTHRHFKGGDSEVLKKERPLLHDWIMGEVFSKL